MSIQANQLPRVTTAPATADVILIDPSTNDGTIINAQTLLEGGGGSSVTVDTALSPTSTNPVQNKAIYGGLQETAEELTDKINDSYSIGTAGPSAVAVIDDGADDIPVKSLVVAIEPVQAGSGDPSPSNIRAINGWGAVKVARTAQNLLPNNYTETIFSRNGITFTVSDDGVVTANGTATAGTYFNFSGWDDDNLPFMHRPGLQLKLSGSYPGVITRLQTRPHGSSTTTTIATDTGTGAEFTVPDDVRAYALFINITSGQTVTNATFHPVISVADEGQPTWSPSEAEVTNITLPTTVYGGTLDVTTGILTVDRASVTLDGSEDEEWIVMATAGIFRNRTITPAIASDAGLVSDKMAVTAYNYNTMKANYPAVSANTGYVYIAISDATTTATQCRAWLAENPVQLVYALATPQTYTLTPVQVKTLLGENRIYADAGQVAVEYRADTKSKVDTLWADYQSAIAAIG